MNGGLVSALQMELRGDVLSPDGLFRDTNH